MRILLTIATIVILAVLVISNLSPSMAVTFLNRQTISLPVGWWLLSAIGVGFISSLSVQILVNFQQRRLLHRLRQLERQLGDTEPEFNLRSTNPQLDDDWGDTSPAARVEPEEEEGIYPEEEEDIYPEDDDEYIEPDSRGEVVDAGFRVIRPPETDEPPLTYAPSPRDRSSNDNGEDWGFDFDDNEDDRSRSSKRR